MPQGSCLGPVVFTQYTSSILYLIHQHWIECHAYADDHQIYSSCSPDNCDAGRESMGHCLRYTRQWMQSMTLKMNDSKTEYIIFGTKQSLAKCHTTSITIGDSTIEASDHIRNLGAYFDKNMSMIKHVKIKCQAAYAQLYNIIKIRRYLDSQSADILTHALVHSHLDYCNSLLAGLPKYLTRKLQLVQNTAAKVIWNY